MNKKILFESIMKHVAKQVKKTLNEGENYESVDIASDIEMWEEYLQEYIEENIETDGRLCAAMFMIYNREIHEDEIKGWLEEIMDEIENTHSDCVVDEIFIDELASFLLESNFVDSLVENFKAKIF